LAHGLFLLGGEYLGAPEDAGAVQTVEASLNAGTKRIAVDQEIRRILAGFDMGPNSGVGGTYLREDLHTFMHNEQSVEATLSLLDACETREQAEYALDLFGRQLWEQNTSFPVLGERLDGQWIRYEDNIRQWQDAVNEIARNVREDLKAFKQIQP
jgi:hypothetical protein